MKKMLSILGSTGLVATSSMSVVSCGEYKLNNNSVAMVGYALSGEVQNGIITEQSNLRFNDGIKQMIDTSRKYQVSINDDIHLFGVKNDPFFSDQFRFTSSGTSFNGGGTTTYSGTVIAKKDDYKFIFDIVLTYTYDFNNDGQGGYQQMVYRNNVDVALRGNAAKKGAINQTPSPFGIQVQLFRSN